MSDSWLLVKIPMLQTDLIYFLIIHLINIHLFIYYLIVLPACLNSEANWLLTSVSSFVSVMLLYKATL